MLRCHALCTAQQGKTCRHGRQGTLPMNTAVPACSLTDPSDDSADGPLYCELCKVCAPSEHKPFMYASTPKLPTPRCLCAHACACAGICTERQPALQGVPEVRAGV